MQQRQAVGWNNIGTYNSKKKQYIESIENPIRYFNNLMTCLVSFLHVVFLLEL